MSPSTTTRSRTRSRTDWFDTCTTSASSSTGATRATRTKPFLSFCYILTPLRSPSRYEKEDDLFGVPQTKVTYFTEVFDARGDALHQETSEDIAMQRLSKIASSRKRLDRSDDVTSMSHQQLKVDMMTHLVFEEDFEEDEWTGTKPTYSEEEANTIAGGLYFEQLFDESENTVSVKVKGHDAESDFCVLRKYKLEENDGGDDKDDDGDEDDGEGGKSSWSPSFKRSGSRRSGGKNGMKYQLMKNKRAEGAFRTYAAGTMANFSAEKTVHTLGMENMAKKTLKQGYKAWARSKSLVNADCLQTFSYFWNFTAPSRRNKHDLEKSVVEVVNDHCTIGYHESASFGHEHKGHIDLKKMQNVRDEVFCQCKRRAQQRIDPNSRKN